MDISVPPMDEWTFLFVQWMNGHLNVQWTFLVVHWTNGQRMDISVCTMDEWTFIYVQWTCNVYNAKEAVMT